MGKWFQEYEDQFEGYTQEMASKNKAKSKETLNYTPAPQGLTREEKGGALIFILGSLIILLIMFTGFLGYEETDKKDATFNKNAEQSIVDGLKTIEEDMNKNLTSEQLEYLKQYGLKNEDRNTDK